MMNDRNDDQSKPPPDEAPDTSAIFIMQKSDAPLETIYSRFIAHRMPFGFQSRDDKEITFHPIPYKPEPDDKLLLQEPWRVVLELYVEEQRMVMGLDLYGDVILGRGQSRPGHIVLNLEEYNAQALGVSREHAMLRPT